MSASDKQHGGGHYAKLPTEMQPWNVLQHWLTPEEYRGWQKGVAIVYLARERDKGGDLDIQKAAHHLERLIEEFPSRADASPATPADICKAFSVPMHIVDKASKWFSAPDRDQNTSIGEGLKADDAQMLESRPLPVLNTAEDAQCATGGERWIDWNGGDCPVNEEVTVCARFRDGGATVSALAGQFRWWHASTSSRYTQNCDIVAYCIAREQA